MLTALLAKPTSGRCPEVYISYLSWVADMPLLLTRQSALDLDFGSSRHAVLGFGSSQRL